jgi:heme exporter protein D
MLEVINYEVFGAFGAVIALMVWLVLYFKTLSEERQEMLEEEREQRARELKAEQAERFRSQERQLEALEATNEILQEMLSKEEKDD